MNDFRKSSMIALACALGFGAFGASSASAQATRTWVSGVGDDVNPCSRTAPCKTFAGAISKTAAGGEINCLDPGGFGGVTITKALTIRCDYTEGGVLVAGAGVSGITINAPATAAVLLSGLDIFGAGTAQNGVRFIAGGSLTIENSVISSFNAANGLGVSFAPSGNSLLYMNNVTVTNNGNGGGGGIFIQPAATGSARVHLVNVRLFANANDAFRVNLSGNTNGLGVLADIENSHISGSQTGISVISATPGTVNVHNSSIFNNSSTALSVNGAAARIRVGNNSITGNNLTTAIAGGGVIESYGDNRAQGNVTPPAFTPPTLPKT